MKMFPFPDKPLLVSCDLYLDSTAYGDKKGKAMALGQPTEFWPQLLRFGMSTWILNDPGWNLFQDPWMHNNLSPESLLGSAVATGATAGSTQPPHGPAWCWYRLLRGYRHDHSKPVLTRGGHGLAGSLNLTDGAMEVSQVASQGPLVHCRNGQKPHGITFTACVCLPTYLPSLPLAARGTVGRS